MVISDNKVPASRLEPLTPSVSLAPPSRLRLHNFDIPLLMKWGSHQVLRCLNINRKGEIITDDRRSNLIEAPTILPDQIRLDETQVSISDNPISDEGKTKFPVQLRNAAVTTDNINQSERDHQSVDLRGHSPAASPPVTMPLSIPPSNSLSIATRPCNRRTGRVPIHKTPCCNVSPPPPLRKSVRKRSVCLVSDNASPPPPPPPPLRKSTRKRSVRLMSDNLEKQEHYPKISISLSRKEIQEDIYTLTGLPPCRRPKKRPRAIKKQLDQLLPGSLLPTITRDYCVRTPHASLHAVFDPGRRSR